MEVSSKLEIGVEVRIGEEEEVEIEVVEIGEEEEVEIEVVEIGEEEVEIGVYVRTVPEEV